MEDLTKKEVIQELIDLQNAYLAVILLNFQSEMETVKNEMVSVLNLLDKISENSENEDEKCLARKKILDSYNGLPRKTLQMIQELISILKEEI